MNAYAITLQFINRVRVEHRLEPLGQMRLGKRGVQDACPIAASLSDIGTVDMRHTPIHINGKPVYFEGLLDLAYCCQFFREFQSGLHPHLEQ